MKKDSIIALLLMAGMAALTSCSSDELTDNTANGKPSSTINANYASLGLPGTRVESEGDIPTSSLAWSTGDKIGVLVNGSNAEFSLSSGSTFAGSVSMDATSAVKGYYPYSSTIDGSATSVSLTIPTAQTQSAANLFNGTDQFPMVADESTQSVGLQFKALAGIYRFKIYDTSGNKGNVKSITVTPASDAKFSGAVTYDFSSKSADYTSCTADAVTLTMTTAIAPAADGNATAQCAYMIAADGATLAGSKICIKTTKGVYNLDLTSMTGDNYTVSAGKVRTMLVNLSNSNVAVDETLPSIASLSNDMPVEGQTLTITGKNLDKVKTVKIGDTEYTKSATKSTDSSSATFTVSSDGTQITLVVSNTPAAGSKVTLITDDDIEAASETLLDANLLIADFNSTGFNYGSKSWGSVYYVDNGGALNDNKPNAYFIGIESGENTMKSTSNAWNFGLMVVGSCHIVTTDAIPAATSLDDIELAFEYYSPETQVSGTNFTVKYPDTNSYTMEMPSLTASEWHTCAISLKNFAKQNDDLRDGTTDGAQIDYSSCTTYGDFSTMIAADTKRPATDMTIVVGQPTDCEQPLNIYITNIRLRLKSATATDTNNNIEAIVPTLSEQDSANSITDFK